MKVLLVLMLGVATAHATCPTGQTCVSWTGVSQYIDGKPIDPATTITYYLYNGVKGGPYTKIKAYNALPGAPMNVQIATPANKCFVVTATVGTVISAASPPGCKQPSAPTNGSVQH